jgi:hypothetical protein
MGGFCPTFFVEKRTMEAQPQEETSVRRPRTPEERHALWHEVQQIWRKRGTDAKEVLAKMRDEWDRNLREHGDGGDYAASGSAARSKVG